jgi:hypothetical protein
MQDLRIPADKFQQKPMLWQTKHFVPGLNMQINVWPAWTILKNRNMCLEQTAI